MKLTKVKLIFYNSVFGLSPILLFYVLTLTVPFRSAVLTTYFFNLFLLFIGGATFTRHRIYCFSLLVSLFAFTFYAMLINVTSINLFCRVPNFSLQLILFGTILAALLNKQRVLRYVNLNFKPTVRADIRVSLMGMYHTFVTLSVLYATHLLLTMLYILIPTLHTIHRNVFIFQYLPPLLLLAVGIYEQIRLYFIREEVKNDHFVYVVDEEGTGIGKIAYSEAVKPGSTYCNPYVRIAIVQNNLIYLTKQPSSSIDSPGKIDVPFGDFVSYGESLNACAHRLLEPTNINPHKTRFVMRHHLVTSRSNRMMFIGIVIVPSKERLHMETYLRYPGKFWTLKQIEEELGSGIFSESFIKEYETIKSHLGNSKEPDETETGV